MFFLRCEDGALKWAFLFLDREIDTEEDCFISENYRVNEVNSCRV
jgi:hypothetical protein